MSTSYPYDLVLFDLDGTLIETAPEIADAVNDTLTQFQLPLVTQQQVNDWIGHGTRELLIQALAFTGHTTADTVRQSDSFKLIEHEFGKHYQQRCGTRSHLYPHVRETLQTVLDAHQMAPLFDRVISGDTLPVKKPNPAGITDCLKQFGMSSDRALFVGDSSIDVATARNAGIAVWALPYGYNMGEPIESCQPDRVIPDFSALTTSLSAPDTAASA